MNKYSNLIILLSILLISSFLVSNSLETSQEEEEIPPNITGFRAPIMDGLLTRSVDPNGVGLSEWEDALELTIELKATNGLSYDVPLLQKMVQGNLYLGLELPADIDPTTIQKLYIQVDRDNDKKLSLGDILIGLSLGPVYDGNNPFELVQVPEGFVFDGSQWVMPIVDEITLPSFLRWGQIAMAIQGGTKRPVAQIEFHVDLAMLDKDLEDDFPSNRVPIGGSAMGQFEDIGYGLGIDQNNGVSIGYPAEPLQPNEGLTYVRGYIAALYDIPPIRFYPQINAGISHIELTQTTQTPDNAYRVIKGKGALARVFVTHDYTAGTVPVIVHLRVFHDAPGSFSRAYSRHLRLDAVTTPDRNNLNHTANFFLDPAVTDFTELLIIATVELALVDFVDPDTSNNRFANYFPMTTTRPFNVYVAAANTGGTFLDMRAQNARLRYTDAIMPTRGINYQTIFWTEIGWFPAGVDGDRITDALNVYFDQTIQARRRQLTNGFRLSPYPHQIHAFVNIAGGKADASWAWGGGRDIASYSGGSAHAEMTMVHELNHNFDGGWGRHVTGFGYGCGAPDGLFSFDWDWNSLYGNDFIQDLGWNPLMNRLVTADYPEIMTYCQAGSEYPLLSAPPTAWIGGYRWERWINYLNTIFTTAAGGTVTPRPTLQTQGSVLLPQEQFSVSEVVDETVRVLSFTIDHDGTAVINPSFEIPGVFNTTVDIKQNDDPDAMLEVKYQNGTVLKIPLNTTTGHQHSSVDTPGELERDIVHYTQTIPDNGELESMMIVNTTDNTVMTEVSVSANILTVGFQGMDDINRGENATVFWNVADNSTTVYSQLMYTPDGVAWYPLGQPTTDFKATVNIHSYRGSNNAQIQILVSEGLSTTAIATDTFVLDNKPPTVEIRRDDRYDTIVDPVDLDQNDMVEKPIHSLIGSTVNLYAFSQDEYGWELPDDSFNWKVLDGTGMILYEVSSARKTFTHVFDTPGTYRIIVTGTDPDTGLQATDEIQVEIETVPFVGSKADLQSFTNALHLARENYDTVTSETTDETDDQNPSETNTSNNPVNASLPLNIYIPVAAVVILGLQRKTRKSRT